MAAPAHVVGLCEDSRDTYIGGGEGAGWEGQWCREHL